MENLNEKQNEEEKQQRKEYLELTKQRMDFLSSLPNSPITTSQSMIENYKEIEKNFLSNYSPDLLANMILLLMIQENYSEASLYIKKSKTMFKFGDNNNNKKSGTSTLISKIEKILLNINNEPYCNINSHLEFFNSVNSRETQVIANVMKSVYEQNQAYFFSRIYSKMLLENLVDYLEPVYDSTSINKYIEKYNLEVIEINGIKYASFENFSINNINKELLSKGIYVNVNVVKDVNEKVNLERMKFINEKANELENIVRMNYFLGKQ